MNTNDFQQISQLLDQKLEPIKHDVESMKEQLGTVEMKVEQVNIRVEKAEQILGQAIKDSQEDTIDSLSELFHTGYTLHEERIKKVEDQLKTSRIQ